MVGALLQKGKNQPLPTREAEVKEAYLEAGKKIFKKRLPCPKLGGPQRVAWWRDMYRREAKGIPSGVWEGLMGSIEKQELKKVILAGKKHTATFLVF